MIRSTLAVALALVCTLSANAAPIFSLPSPLPFRNNSWSFGEIFTVGVSDITVTSLGAYDAGGNGFVSAGGLPVGIFRESDGVLLTSTNVQSGDPLIAGFRYHTIAPLTLQSGEQYRVVAVNLDDLYNIDVGFTVLPLVTRTGYGYANSTTLVSSNFITGTDRIFLANFQAELAVTAVPEPATLAVFGGIALAGAFGYRRRKAAPTTAA